MAKLSVVYFLQVGVDGPIKIGCTGCNVYMRIQQLQQAAPCELRWIGAFLGNRDDERAAHARLAEHRKRGEWFFPTEAVRAFVIEKSGPGWTPETFLDRECMKAERDEVRAALRASRRTRDELVKLAGWRGFDNDWWLYLAPPNRAFVNALIAAIPLLGTLPPKPKRSYTRRKAPPAANDATPETPRATADVA